MPAVAYLGPEKTNCYYAARKKFGPRVKYLHAPTVEDVFRMIERKDADFGLVPIENSLEGAVTHTLDRFTDPQRSTAKICGEVDLSIEHHLITLRGTDKSRIRVVYSHPQALAQCRSWLERNLPNVARQETSSTAEAVEALSRDAGGWKSDERGAIGRKELGEDPTLQSLRIPIERENRTRFLILCLKIPKPGKKNKTSLMFALKDKPGALHDALVPFKENRINLTKIESRPTKRKAWEYVFFVDLMGHESEARVKKAIAGLRRSTAELQVLGSYPLGSGA